MPNHLQTRIGALPPVLSSFPPAASLRADVRSQCAVAAQEIVLANPPSEISSSLPEMCVLRLAGLKENASLEAYSVA